MLDHHPLLPARPIAFQGLNLGREGPGQLIEGALGAILLSALTKLMRESAAENHSTLRVNAMDLKNVLRKIDTNRDNLCHRAAPISLWFMKTTILVPRCRRVGAVHRIKPGHWWRSSRRVDPLGEISHLRMALPKLRALPCPPRYNES
jgi:hypothetical protein